MGCVCVWRFCGGVEAVEFSTEACVVVCGLLRAYVTAAGVAEYHSVAASVHLFNRPFTVKWNSGRC
jgi:hypothetical protein